jgi:hypothetical protein
VCFVVDVVVAAAAPVVIVNTAVVAVVIAVVAVVIAVIAGVVIIIVAAAAVVIAITAVVSVDIRFLFGPLGNFRTNNPFFVHITTSFHTVNYSASNGKPIYE